MRTTLSKSILLIYKKLQEIQENVETQEQYCENCQTHLKKSSLLLYRWPALISSGPRLILLRLT